MGPIQLECNGAASYHSHNVSEQVRIKPKAHAVGRSSDSLIPSESSASVSLAPAFLKAWNRYTSCICLPRVRLPVFIEADELELSRQGLALENPRISLVLALALSESSGFQSRY